MLFSCHLFYHKTVYYVFALLYTMLLHCTHWPPALMKLFVYPHSFWCAKSSVQYVHTHMFWYSINHASKFARNCLQSCAMHTNRRSDTNYLFINTLFYITICVYVRFGFTTKTIGEHGSPLQYNNNFATFIGFCCKHYIFFYPCLRADCILCYRL